MKMATVNRDEALPEHVRGLPVEVQVAVLYERVGNLTEDVKGLKTIILGGIVTLLTGMLLGAVSIAAGWLGPHAGATVAAAVWRLLT